MNLNLNEELSPYISALVHNDGDKVKAFVPADSLVKTRSVSVLGMFRIDIRFDLRQPINQWLCIVFLGCVAIAILIYYFTHNAIAIAEELNNFAP